MTQNHREDLDPLIQLPTCPVCHRADQVQTVQTAYQQGMLQLQPPPSTRRSVGIWAWVIAGAVVIVCAAIQFFLFVQVGGPRGFQNWPIALQVAEVVVAATLLAILTSLSLLAFGRLVNTKKETVWRYPTDEGAGDTLRQFYHCGRDNVVFDANQKKVLSPAELHTLLQEAAQPWP